MNKVNVVFAGTLGVVAALILRNMLKVRRFPKTKKFLSILDRNTGQYVIHKVEIIGEQFNGLGLYLFHTADGKNVEADLRDGNWSIIRSEGD